MKNELVNIDIDLIKRMRYEGRNGEADNLLEAFRESVQKEKKQNKKEIRRTERKIKITHGICGNFGCNNQLIPGQSMCEKCYLSKNGKKYNFVRSKRVRKKCLNFKKCIWISKGYSIHFIFSINEDMVFNSWLN